MHVNAGLMGSESRFQASSEHRQLDWHDWQPSAPYSLGMEEEVMLVDPVDWSLAQRIETVLEQLPPTLA